MVDLQYCVISGIQKSDSISLYIYILFCYRLLQVIEYSSQCYTINLYYLFYIWWCVSVNSILLIYPLPFGNHMLNFYESVSVL